MGHAIGQPNEGLAAPHLIHGVFGTFLNGAENESGIAIGNFQAFESHLESVARRSGVLQDADADVEVRDEARSVCSCRTKSRKV